MKVYLYICVRVSRCVCVCSCVYACLCSSLGVSVSSEGVSLFVWDCVKVESWIES